MEDDDIILSSSRRLLADKADIQTLLAAKGDGWKHRLWSEIEDNGLTIAAVPEDLGGAGLGIRQSLAILRIAGNMALSVPLAETMIAGWMLGAAALELPAGKTTFASASPSDEITYDAEGTVSGSIARLSFARECEHAALLAQGADSLVVVLVALGDASITARDNLAYEPSDRVSFDGAPVISVAPAPAGFTRDTTLLIGSAARSMQIAGALERMLSITTEYVTQRRAFERAISKFQAVQHSVAQLAGETAVALSAAESAAEALASLAESGKGFDDPETMLEVMAARIRVCAAAQKGAAIAHQLHGAIGITREHILHRLTLRALAWRDDYGTESEWSRRLGDLVCGRGAQALWPLLASR